MYAIIKTGGKQYRVKAGDTVKVEKLNFNLGEEIEVQDVLLVGSDSKTFVGEPNVDKAVVKAVVIQQAKLPKVVVFKRKRRQGYRRMQGHRQLFTELFVTSITSPEGETSSTEEKAQVIDPAKKAERLAAQKEKAAADKKAGKKPAKKAAKKKTAKKAAKKSAKKATAKKKAAKKVAKKKTAKKAAKKKTTKKA